MSSETFAFEMAFAALVQCLIASEKVDRTALESAFKANEELILERIATAPDGGAFLRNAVESYRGIISTALGVSRTPRLISESDR